MNENVDRAPKAETKARVFISYSRNDMGFADQLEAALTSRGFEALIDRTEIYAFEDWWQRIQALIVRADTVIFVLSSDAISSDICRKEVAFAASLNKRFAPIVCRPVDVANVPGELSRLNFISFEDKAHFENNADKLADALSTDIEWIRKHTEFGELARRWSEAGRPGPKGLLLRSPLLEEAEQWLAQQPKDAPSPTEAIRAFIAESRKAQNLERRRARRTSIVLSSLTLMLIAAVFAWWKHDDALRVLELSYQRIWEDYYWHFVMKPSALTADQERAITTRDEFTDCKNGCPTMVVIPAGKFTMGSPEGEYGRNKDEGPLHEVTITRPFAVSKFDVTFAEWDTCVEARACLRSSDIASDEDWGRGDRPVINVNWNDAKLYVVWLSRVTGKEYSLLSESEWEYAARGGTTTAYYWGDEIGNGNANCLDCGSQWDNKQTSPVGSFKPNAFGLYDMIGNVWQWLEDCQNDTFDGAPNDGSAWISGDCSGHVVRGGPWNYGSKALRVAERAWFFSGYRENNVSFRIARTLSK